MKPGRELDVLIAMHIFKLDVQKDQITRSIFAEKRWDDDLEYFVGKTNDKIPYYSTDIKAAWLVVEKFSKPNPANVLDDDNFPPLRINALIRLKDGRWMARFDREAELESYYERSTYNTDDDYAIGDTAPHAICLAALKAIGP